MVIPAGFDQDFNGLAGKWYVQTAFLLPLLIPLVWVVILGNVIRTNILIIDSSVVAQVSLVYTLGILYLFVTITDQRVFQLGQMVDGSDSTREEIDDQLSILSDEINALRANTEHAMILEDETDTEDNVRDHYNTHVDHETIDKALMIEYSSDRAYYIRDDLLDSGTEVYLLVKRPDEAVGHDLSPRETTTKEDFNPVQPEKIFREIFVSMRENKSANEFENLHLRFYTGNASLRGRLFDSDHIYVGWYTQNPGANLETSGIWGDVNPMVYLPGDHTQFDYLSNFMLARAAPDLWNTGVTPEKLYQEKVPWIRNWVDTVDSEDRREFLQKVSDRVDGVDADFETAFDITISGADDGVRRVQDRE